MSDPNKTIILTGATGTIGQVLLKQLTDQHYKVIVWNRNETAIDDYHQMFNYINKQKPVAFIHLAAITSFDSEKRINSWQVNYEWPSEIAWICRELKIKFIFISTNLVFQKSGPYYIDTAPDAASGYGYEKLQAEKRVIYQNPETIVLRLGWQIAEYGNNSLITWLDNMQDIHSCIELNINWLPSCSFVEDTCSIIVASVNYFPGIYMINANKDNNMFQIATFLKKNYQKEWNLIPVNGQYIDQRMFDERIKIDNISYHHDKKSDHYRY